MASVALRRLMTEYKRTQPKTITYINMLNNCQILELVQNPPEGILAGPVDEENFFEWDCLVTGPEGTCFENGLLTAKLYFSEVFGLVPIFRISKIFGN